MTQAQSSLEDLQKRKALAEAEKAAIDAELARDESKSKLAAAQAPADLAKKAQDSKLEAAKSAKALADAEKAQADAEAAAVKAKIGEVPTSGISGGVKVEQGAASFETALLAAQSTVTASQRIAEAVAASASSVTPSAKRILVFAAGELPDFQATTGFLAQRALVLQALVDAVAQSEDAKKALTGTESVESVGTIGVALDAVTKLLGFFKSDFEVRGNDVAADHLLLAKAVTGELLKACKELQPVLYLKATFNPTAVAAVGALLKQDLESLNFQRAKAVAALTEREREVASRQAELAKITGDTPADRATKQLLMEQQRRQQGAVDKLKSALAAYDAFVGKLASPDASVAAMIREYEVWSALSDSSSLTLVVKMDKAGGSNYVEKNLWTSVGGMPFKVMGGVITSYTLFQGNTGAVLASGVVPVHGGFRNVDKLGDLFR